jgi:hypothetical protein
MNIVTFCFWISVLTVIFVVSVFNGVFPHV